MSFGQLQHTVSDLVAEDDSSLADHLSLSKQLPDYIDKLPGYFRKIKVAFLSNFTLLGLPEVFRVRAIAYNIWADTYLGPYNQYAQEILNTANELHRFQPQLIYLLIDSVAADENQVSELIGVLQSRSIAVKLIWDSAIKEKFGDYWYTKYKELGDLRLAPEIFSVFADQELMGEAVAVSGATKKCLVVDLDNTLWQGIVGENDYNEIKPERDLQRHILDLYGRGVVLAVNSRNNYNDAVTVMDEHGDMILGRNHFAALRINWQDKADNIVELAQELNLGLDSFVFVDDDPFQRISVQSRFPEVAVLPPEKLKNYPGFSSLTLTKEDKKRSQMYAEENKRRGLQSSLADVADFLKQLNLEIEVMPVGPDNLTRVSQLTQKTNQFNLTTRRYSEKEIENFVASGWKVWSLGARDRFGDYGIIGVCMVEPKADIWRIDSFLLSCRILGREVEKAFLAQVMAQARRANAAKISGEFIPTAKNEPCQSFYPSNGFDLVKENDKVFFYERDLDIAYETPDFIKVSVV